MSTEQNPNRNAAILAISKPLGHTNGYAWLRDSNLTTLELVELHDKFHPNLHVLFRAVDDFTPRELLELNPFVVTVYSSVLSETVNPALVHELTNSELALIWKRLIVTGLHKNDPTTGNALVVACKGNATERRLAKTFPTRRFSHHSYLPASEKLQEMAMPYLSRIGAI